MGKDSEFSGGPYGDVDQDIKFVHGDSKTTYIGGFKKSGTTTSTKKGQTFDTYSWDSKLVEVKTYEHGGRLEFVSPDGEYSNSSTSSSCSMSYRKGKGASLKGNYKTWYN